MVVAKNSALSLLQVYLNVLDDPRCKPKDASCCSMFLAVGLEGYRSRDGRFGPQSHYTNHCQTSVLDFTVPAFGQGFRRFVLVQTEGVVQSWDHVLLIEKNY